MEIRPAGSAPTKAGPPDYFTGKVWQDSVAESPEPGRLRALLVTFEPGARTHWHTHPLGQTLYVLTGAGLAQSENGPVRRIRAGDVVVFAPGEKHWHGAGPDTMMVHLAMQEAKDGAAVAWLEPVTDADYSVKAS
jgi:quercetin dioxygenase-like cupin family protein